MSSNFLVTYNKNISKLLQDAEVFGLWWLGDGATIKRMPLFNILVLCGNVPSAVVSIVDCTTHMSDGGGRKMQHILWTNSKRKWMRLMMTEISPIVSSLMVHQMSKPLLPFYVQCTLARCVSMEGSMSCCCFSVTSPNSNHTG